MSRILIGTVTILTLCLACTERVQNTPRVPRPGDERVPQVYMLVDKSVDSLTGELPTNAELKNQMGARVERKEVAKPEEAADTLQVWNGRPTDILILGPGLPQQVFARLKLPRVEGRLVLALATQQNSPDWVSIRLSQTALKKFEDRFCASKMAKGQCLVLPTPSGAKVPQNPTAIVSIGRELENTPTGQPVTLSVVPNWGALIGHLRASRKYQVQPQHIELDFKSGFLEIRLGPASTKFEPELDNFLKLWNLEQLSAGAVKR